MAEVPTTMTVTRLISPDEWAEKQLKVVTAVGKSNYLGGIARPRKSPIGAGSSDWSEAKFNSKMTVVLEKKSRQKGVAKSSDDIWFGLTKTLGADNYVKGVKAREYKIKAFTTSFQPKLLAHCGRMDALPVATFDERMSKMTENARGLAALHA